LINLALFSLLSFHSDGSIAEDAKPQAAEEDTIPRTFPRCANLRRSSALFNISIVPIEGIKFIHASPSMLPERL